MNEASSELLSVRSAHRLDLTLNRPARRNALSLSLVESLTRALADADQDPELRLIVLTGAGDQAFCAGGDLAGDLGDSGVEGSARAFADLMLTMHGLGTPILARVQGHCMGGGLGLMIGCDLAVAADDIKLGTPEVRSGIFPMMIAPLIVQSVGPKRAHELFFTGQRIDAPTALDWGMLNRCVAREQLDRSVDALADQVLSAGPAAIRIGRQAMAATRHLPLKQAAPILAEKLVEVLSTEDAMEGISAFLQKRKPDWKGR
jgi:enoyl-CoA hydratase/carnithine racemase